MHHFNRFLVFSGLSAIFGFAHVLIAPVLAPYIKSFGFTEFQVGLIFAMFGFTLIWVSPMIGRISDHMGRSRVIIFGLFTMITGMMLYYFGHGWLALVLGRVFEAIGSAAVGLIALARIEDYLKNKERGRYTGLNQSINQIGLSLAPLAGGFLAVQYGVKAPFAVSALVLGILFLILIVKTPHHKRKLRRSDFNLLDEWKSFWKIKPLRAMAILGYATHGAGSAFWVFLPIYLVDKIGVDYSFIGYMFFALGFFHIFQFYFGKLADKWGRKKFILYGVFFMGLTGILLAFAQNFYHIILICLAHSLAGALFNTSTWTFMSDIAEEVQHEGEYLGSYLSFAKMGAFSQQIIGGAMITFISFKFYFIASGLFQIFLLLIASYYINKKA